jgi:hypothetical protein
MFEGYLEATVGFAITVAIAFVFSSLLGVDATATIAGAALFRALLVDARLRP